MIRADERRAVATAEGGRLAALYEAHAPEAARLAYLLTGDRALAEDVVHQAFVRLLGRFRDLRHPEAFRAYLRTTVVNMTRSHFRRRRVERAYVEREGRRQRSPRRTPRAGRICGTRSKASNRGSGRPSSSGTTRT